MKRIACEMCGGTDLIKENGVFVCQSCGTKYSVEEAKKLMIEGTVDVSGSTIKIDTTTASANYIENARRALKKEDWEEGEKYFNLAEQNDSSNIEAIFYSSYCKARMLMLDTDHYKRLHGIEVLANTTSIIDDNYNDTGINIIKQLIVL